MVQSSRALTEGISHRRGKGAGPEHRSFTGEPARGCLLEALGAASNRAKAKRRKACAPRGEPASGGKPRYPSGGRVCWRRFGVKFCVLTRRDLPASAVGNHER